MKKEAYYFPHDCNARNDEKILAIRMRYGAEGYGIYFMIIERLRESTNYISIKDYNVLAFDFRVSADKVKSIVEDFGLFQFTDNGKLFYSESLSQRMQPLENLRKQRSNAGQKSGEKRAKSATDERPFDKSLTTVDQKSNKEDYIILDNIKEEEKKEKEKKKSPPTPKGDSEKKLTDKNSLSYKARILFENHFRETFGSSYYWAAKDAGAMKQLLSKLEFSMKSKNWGAEISDNEKLDALKFMLNGIRDGWIFDNFSVPIINSKFNEIISQIKSNARNSNLQSTASRTNQKNGYNSARTNAEERKRSVEDLADLARTILQQP